MNVDLGDLRAFVAVAELGSFNDAAVLLNLSQPALSRRVQKLEETLGVNLLERTTRRVGLTTVGRDFLPKARRLLDDLDTSLLSVREIAERRSGQVNVACVPTAAYYFLPAVIRAFNEEYPRIRIRIVDENANTVLQSVIDGEADLGINLSSGQGPDIDFDPLVEDPFVLACRSDHPLAKKHEVKWRDIEPYRFITVGRVSGNRLILDLGLAGVEWRPKWFYEVQHLSSALGLVEAGLGVAAMPRLAMPREPHPTLTARPLIDPVLTRKIGIIKRHGAALSPAARQFHDLLKARWSEPASAKVDERFASKAPHGASARRRRAP